MMNSYRQQVAELLESQPGGSRASAWAGRFLVVLILANVAAIVAESVQRLGTRYAGQFEAFELFSVVVFTLEYLLRLWSCVELPSARKPGHRMTRAEFALSPLGLVDLLAILPFYLALLIPGQALSLIVLRTLRALRLLRVLKLARYSPALNLLLNVLHKEARSLAVAVVILGVMLVFASFGIWSLEREAQPEDFGSIPAAMWWAVITLTTVGFGDVVPVTGGGKVFAGFVALIGIGMVALPSAILVSGLNREMHRRQETFRRAVYLAAADRNISEFERQQLEVLHEELGLHDDGQLQAAVTALRHQRSGTCPHCGKTLVPELSADRE